jgi:uncharacterized protein (DUF305 family)
MSNRSLPRRIARGCAAAAAVLAFAAACGDSGHDGATGDHNAAGAPSAPASAAPGLEHNQADLTFAQSMIPHHQQAVEMADLAQTRASDPKVKALADKISKAQGPEITTMSGWLAAWGGPGASMPAGESHGDMGEMGTMPGMMTAEEMAGMQSATGAAFDRIFLQMMIKHHQGAVEMARTEQQQGLNPDAKALAATVERDQTAEIAEMQAMLGS